MRSADTKYDFRSKYTEINPVTRLLLDRFYRNVGALVTKAGPSSALEVGCGEGFSTARLQQMMPATELAASDVELRLVRAARARNPSIPIAQESIVSLERPTDGVDLVFCLEVLEHLFDPDRALVELCRVTRRWLVLSVPREPLWRALNVARLKYWKALGNTPGHIQHWSSRGFVRFVERHADVVAVRRPLPWVQVLARVR